MVILWHFGLALLASGGVPAAQPAIEPAWQHQSVLLLEYNCELAQLGRADELIELAFAPILDDLVDRSRLTGWVWLRRDLGDEWSRAFYITAADRTTLLEARDEAAERLHTDVDPLRVEFLSICRESRFRVYAVGAGRMSG